MSNVPSQMMFKVNQLRYRSGAVHLSAHNLDIEEAANCRTSM
jgi:hypothetical protein